MGSRSNHYTGSSVTQITFNDPHFLHLHQAQNLQQLPDVVKSSELMYNCDKGDCSSLSITTQKDCYICNRSNI